MGFDVDMGGEHSVPCGLARGPPITSEHHSWLLLKRFVVELEELMSPEQVVTA